MKLWKTTFIETQTNRHMKVGINVTIELEQNYESLKKENDALKSDLEDALKNKPIEQKTSSIHCWKFC